MTMNEDQLKGVRADSALFNAALSVASAGFMVDFFVIGIHGL